MEYGAYLAVMSIISKMKRKESHETALMLRWKTAATWDTVNGCRSNGNPGTVVYTAIMWYTTCFFGCCTTRLGLLIAQTCRCHSMFCSERMPLKAQCSYLFHPQCWRVYATHLATTWIIPFISWIPLLIWILKSRWIPFPVIESRFVGISIEQIQRLTVFC